MEAWLLFPVRLITVAIIAFVVFSLVDRGHLQQLEMTAVRSEADASAVTPPEPPVADSRYVIPILAGVATFVAALALGESLAIRSFSRACRQIVSLGGSIRFNPPQNSMWARRFFSTATVDLSDTSINDQIKIDFAAIPLLKTLRLANTQVAGETMRTLRNCSRLQGLDLTGTAIRDEDLQHVSAIASLRSLILNGTAVTDASIPHLKSCVALQELQCQDTAIAQSHSLSN